MDQQSNYGNAFEIPDLWKTSSLAHFDEDATGFTLDRLEPLTESQDGQQHRLFFYKELDLHFPDFPAFDTGPVNDLGFTEESSVSSSVESLESPEVTEVDVWNYPIPSKDVQDSAGLLTWESFYHKDFHEPRTIYLSEGGPRVFDAALCHQPEKKTTRDLGTSTGRVVKSDPLLSSLLQLALGRESVLYRYAEDDRTFRSCLDDGRMSGYSLDTFTSLSTSFVQHGNQMRSLREFIVKKQRSARSSPAMIALTGSCSSILSLLEAQIGAPKTAVRSLLQLQSLFEQPGQILSCLHDIVAKIHMTNTDEELLSTLYRQILERENSSGLLRSTLLPLLASASRPWLDLVGGWLGLQKELAPGATNQSKSFYKAKEEVERTEGEATEIQENTSDFDPLPMPEFVSQDDSLVILETGRSLRLLESHELDHPLVKLTNSTEDEPVMLEWQFSWRNIERIATRAKEYESSLLKAIKVFHTHGSAETATSDDSQGNIEAVSAKHPEQSATDSMAESIAIFERPLPDLHQILGRPSLKRPTQISSGSETMTEEEMFTPPLALLAALSFNPLISVQANLINQACLRLLFKQHSLRSHFALLHRYSLFGDGVFASRLSHALFDPEFPSAESRKGYSRLGTSGLKLGYRDTWPPASSELRLALMGILTDSYFPKANDGSSIFRPELPGGLSFAIREMSEDEFKRCMNPNSIEALDFLQLQYRPPPPLDAVISATSLVKYDAIFRLLLRSMRMLFAVNQLSRDTAGRSSLRRPFHTISSSFMIQSRHFVSAVCAYFFDGVTANWSVLEQKLGEVDNFIDHHSGRNGESLRSLREFHELILDRMMLTLLLRKRQAQVMKLLEEIFSTVLLFVKLARNPAGESAEPESNVEMRNLFDIFKKKVRVFISVCRGLSERRGQGGTKRYLTYDALSKSEEWNPDGGNTIAQLLLKFEMTEFYSL